MDSVPARSAIRPSSRASRPSQSQVNHRRPHWAKNERSYQRYIEHPPIRKGNPVDYGYDNFSYYPPHLVETPFPDGLLPQLPEGLGEQAKLLVLSKAACHTALDRVKRMDEDAPNRADPQTTYKHLLNRRASDYVPTVVGAENATSFSTHTMPQPAIHSPYTPGVKKPLMPTVPQLPVNMMGLESPPFTPVDSKVANTPINDGAKGMQPTDLARVNAQLSKTALTTESAAIPVKNEIAYMFYVNQYNAEIAEIKSHAYKRLDGYDRTITRLFFEYMHDEGLSMDQKAALKEFESWWMNMKKKMAELKTEIYALEEKRFGSPEQTEAAGKDTAGISI